MTDKTCHQCGEDPGPTSRCSNCGSIVYRYATEELVELSTSSAELESANVVSSQITPTPPRPTNPSQGSAQRDLQRQLAYTQQGATDPFGNVQQRHTSPGQTVLFRMVLIGLVLATGIGSQFGGWVESQANSLRVAPTLEEVDINTTIPEPILLEAWADLRRGDCVLWPSEGDVLILPTVTNCNNQHDAEISAVTELSHDEWPFADDSLDLGETCKEDFVSYVGREFALSRWRVGWVTPTEDEWARGDHSYQCFVYIRGEQNSQRAYQSGS